MSVADRSVRLQHFVEEMGLLWEESGVPRMRGRIIGWLLVCEPAAQTAAQLANALSASKGSISTNTRALLQLGILERAAVPGERATYFQLAERAWPRFMMTEMTRITLFREGAERGLALLADAPAARSDRLREFHDLFSFIEREYPMLMQHYAEWQATREDR